ncbi:MAG: hypothetical protein Q9202_003645 [Teloschistes flavicans]
MFSNLSRHLLPHLSVDLLQWDAGDFPFREIAYATLCLAAGGKFMSVISLEQLGLAKAHDHKIFGYIQNLEPSDKSSKSNNADSRPTGTNGRTENVFYSPIVGCNPGQVDYKNDPETLDPEFFSFLTYNYCLKGNTPGSAPDETLYWLNGALILLIIRLYLQMNLDDAPARIIQYHVSKTPRKHINTVLMSIEHIVLVKLFPSGQIQHTPPLHLFEIRNHLSLAAQDRYSAPYLQHLHLHGSGLEKRSEPEHTIPRIDTKEASP